MRKWRRLAGAFDGVLAFNFEGVFCEGPDNESFISFKQHPIWPKLVEKYRLIQEGVARDTVLNSLMQ